MNNGSNRLIAIVVVIVGVAWCFGIYTIANIFNPPLVIGGGLLFGIFAIVASITYNSVFRKSPGKQSPEVAALPAYASIIYVVSTLLLNTCLVLIKRGDFNSVLVLVNLCINLAYFVVILFAELTARRTLHQLIREERKISQPTEISSRLGSLVSIAEDEEIKRRLLKLKEDVDYSSNLSTFNTLDLEIQVLSILDELQEVIRIKGDTDIILERIKSAEITWKIRSNSAVKN